MAAEPGEATTHAHGLDLRERSGDAYIGTSEDRIAVVAHALLGPVGDCAIAAHTLLNRMGELPAAARDQLLRDICAQSDLSIGMLLDLVRGGNEVLVGALDALAERHVTR
jgi:hypothetical protein